MSRSRTRARTCRALREKVYAEFEMKRENPEAFAAFLQRLSESDYCVWAIARIAARNKPLDEDERAMIAQIVAPHLACMSSGSIYHRGKIAQ
jgi:hypothetical protein